MSATDGADRTQHLSVRLRGQGGAAVLSGDHVATLTVTCPLEQQEVSVLCCAFCEHSEGLTLSPPTDILRLRCRTRARRSQAR